MNYEFGLYVFMLAAFLGFELIRRVSPLLHTPLMSLTNAISAIIIVGAMLAAGGLRRDDIKAGCGRCGACSTQATYEA